MRPQNPVMCLSRDPSTLHTLGEIPNPLHASHRIPSLLHDLKWTPAPSMPQREPKISLCVPQGTPAPRAPCGGLQSPRVPYGEAQGSYAECFDLEIKCGCSWVVVPLRLFISPIGPQGHRALLPFPCGPRPEEQTLCSTLDW